MNIIENNKIDFQLIKHGIAKPAIFEKGTAIFWDDEYISEQMLKLHLNPDIEAASKTKATIEAETDFIIKLTKMDGEKSVLDLGCGPGLYAKKFAETGAAVTGIDLSQRSVDYANKYVKSEYLNTAFIKLNYLDISFKDSFDIATLIFYDFCALNVKEQNLLLKKIHAALKDNGFFIFDVVSDNKETATATSLSVSDGGFWSSKPYLEILNTYIYEEPKTEGLQYVIIDEDGLTKIFRIYHRLFSETELTQMLYENGFLVNKVYNNLKGEAFGKDSPTYGIIAMKA